MSTNMKRIWSSIGKKVSSLWTAGEEGDNDGYVWDIEDSQTNTGSADGSKDKSLTTEEPQDTTPPVKRRKIEAFDENVSVIPDSQPTLTPQTSEKRSPPSSVFHSGDFLKYVYPAVKPIDRHPKTDDSEKDVFYPETVLDTALTLSCFVPMSCSDILLMDPFEKIYGKKCEIPLPDRSTGGPFFFRNHPILFVSCFGKCQFVERKSPSNLLIMSLDDSSGKPIEIVRFKDTTVDPQKMYDNKYVHIKGIVSETKGFPRSIAINQISVVEDVEPAYEFDVYDEAMRLRENFLSKRWVVDDSKLVSQSTPSKNNKDEWEVAGQEDHEEIEGTKQDEESSAPSYQYVPVPTQYCVWSQESQAIELTDDLDSERKKSQGKRRTRRTLTEVDDPQSPDKVSKTGGDNEPSPSSPTRYIGPKRLF